MIDKNLITLNDITEESQQRHYLGLSQIGEKCHRKLQYDHYWAYKIEFSARMNRLFQVGHNAEPIMIDDLAKIGITVTDQQLEIIATAGHWKGHIDGIGNKEFLVEFKTHNDKSFKDLKKKMVKESKPTHYDQMTSYMGYLDLKSALYMAYNKNDSEYYLEWIRFDPEHFKELQRKEMEVISAEELLPRIGTDTPTWFECKFCSANKVCFGIDKIEANCRTCDHVDVLDKGQWHCSLYKKGLSLDDQIAGCNSYTKAKMFI